MKKKISVGQTARQSNRRGINDAAWDDGDCKKKREKRIFSRANRFRRRRARKLASRTAPISLVRRERSRGRKGLIEFLLINCLRGATIIATHELSHYRNCGSN